MAGRIRDIGYELGTRRLLGTLRHSYVSPYVTAILELELKFEATAGVELPSAPVQ